MAYPEAFEWSCAEELYAYCTSITPAQLAESGERARAHYEAFHRPSEIRKVLERNHSLVASQVPKKEKNTSDGCIEAEEICAQAGLYHLFMARLRWSIVQVYAFLSRNLSRCVR
jgi:hypothetical protein